MKRAGLFFSWLAATVLVSWFTYQGLSAADAEVRDRPETAVVVATDEPLIVAVGDTGSTSSTTETTVSSSTPLAPGSTSPIAGGANPTSGGSSGNDDGVSGGGSSDTSTTSTTIVADSISTTSGGTSTSTTATTSTTVVEAWKTTTITSPGGDLTVSYRTGEVRYEVAIPAAGYELEIDSTGPSEVRVEFVGDDSDWEIRARWNDGAFDPEVNEK